MASDDSIDFGGRFARQFFENNWPNLDDEPSPVPTHHHHQHHHHQSSTNPITSTPIASDNSICDSGYESLNQHRKSSTSPTSSFQHGLVDVNNNNVNCQTPTSTKQQTMASVASAAAAIAAAVSLPSVSSSSASSLVNSGCTTTLTSVGGSSSSSSTSALSGTQLVATSRPSSSPLNNNSSGGVIISAGNSDINNNHTNIGYHGHQHSGSGCCNHTASNACSTSSSSANNQSNAVASLTADDLAKLSAGIGLMKLIMTPDVVVRQQRSNSLFTTTPAMSTSLGATNPWSSQDLYQRFSNVDKIERAASLHRTAASYSEPQYTWSGQLPSRSYKNPVFSCKVFLGGVPWDVTEQGLIETFGRFGPLRVQWPGKDVRHQSGQTKHGYVYLIYESERYVKALLQACTQDFGAGSHPEKYYYQISSRRMRFKEVQVIPWVLADSNYIRNQSGRPDSHRTVFVGALHGMLTAEGLAKVMNDLFGGVAYVGIDSDKHKYPLGSGRVTFINQRSYMKAVSAGFIEVKSSQFCKKIQVDPYFEPSQCSTCHIQSAPIFCRDCLRYFCKTCWSWHHSSESIAGKQHLPLMRKKRET